MKSILKVLIALTGLLGTVFILFIWFRVPSGCNFRMMLNPDITCRVTDGRDGKLLVEYFNLDTNELRLYIRQDGKDDRIEHPDKRVKTFYDRIDQNTIRFDPANDQMLLVNGEKFAIVPHM